MARGDGIHRTNARNMRLTAAKIGNVQQHNEREKESYANQDIVPERTQLNVHFKKPAGSYAEMFQKLKEDGVISTRGLKEDAFLYGELVFDVNTAYFHNHGGYDFAEQFYTDAYKSAIEIVGGEQYILSAVMHADERNRAMSDALGQDVYHYWDKHKHYFVRKMDSFSFRMFDEFYNCASEILEQQQLMKNLQKNSLFLTQQMLMQSETNYILQILAMCAQNPVDVPTLLKTIEGSLPADASDEQKTAFENLMKRMTASNQNIDPNTFWNTYNQSKANLHSVINQNALTHYIPVQIRITLENALKKYNAIQVIGCEGYRKLKKIGNRKF